MAHSDFVQSLQRGMMIIDLVARSGSGMTMAELAEALDVKRPTAFNLTRTLIAQRYLEKTSRPVRFLLGPAILENAEAWRHRELARKFEQLVKRLAGSVPHATVALAEALGGEVIAVHLIDKNIPGVVQHSSTRRLAPYIHASTLCFLAFWPPDEAAAYQARYPFHEYGAGIWGTEQKLAAFLQQTRSRGYVAWNAPNHRFLVSAPVYSKDSSLLAAVGVSVASPPPLSEAAQAAIVRKATAAVAALHRE